MSVLLRGVGDIGFEEKSLVTTLVFNEATLISHHRLALHCRTWSGLEKALLSVLKNPKV